MKRHRVEIIASMAVEEDLADRLAACGVDAYYTKTAPVFGRGSSGERRGDHVWPEENFMLLFYCDDEELAGLRRAVRQLKALYPEEGVKLFALSGSFEEL